MQAPRVRIALAITSHERPDALAAVLASIARLRVPPDEIVIADDGSGARNAGSDRLIHGALARARTPGRAASRRVSRRATAQSRHRRDLARLPRVHRRRHGAAPRIHRGPRAHGATGHLHPGHSRACRRAAHTDADRRRRELCLRRSRAAQDSCGAPICCTRRSCPRCCGVRAMDWLPSRAATRVSGATTWCGSMASTRTSSAGDPKTRSCAPVSKTRVSGARRCCSAASPATCTMHRHRASNCPGISRGSRPRAASARFAVNADWILHIRD